MNLNLPNITNLFLLLGLISVCPDLISMVQQFEEPESYPIGNVIINNIINNTDKIITLQTKDRVVTINPGQEKKKLNLFVGQITSLSSYLEKTIPITWVSSDQKGYSLLTIVVIFGHAYNFAERTLYAKTTLKTGDTRIKTVIGEPEEIRTAEDDFLTVYIDLIFAGDILENSEIDIIAGFGKYEAEKPEIKARKR